MNDNLRNIQTICDWLRSPSLQTPQAAIVEAFQHLDELQIESLAEVLLANFDEFTVNPRRLRLFAQLFAGALLRSLAAGENAGGAIAMQPVLPPELIEQLYQRLAEVDSHSAAHMLQILAAQGDEESLVVLAATLSESGPEDWRLIGLAISPLWKASSSQLELFFERLGADFMQPVSLSALLDLANYSVEHGRLEQHPWESRRDELAKVLEALVAQLEQLHRNPNAFGSDVSQVQRVLEDTIALTVSLIRALGLFSIDTASGQAPSQRTNKSVGLDGPTTEASVCALQQAAPTVFRALVSALEVGHRRVQTEAAAALAKHNSEPGKRRLLELASDPVARYRAVRFAEELGLDDEIDEAYRTSVALAESELTAWLASPSQFGVAPQAMEHIDSRTMYWPSYEEPRDCHLFQYTYQLPQGVIRNVGIAGPATHAFYADLTTLDVDDMYATFAGWQAEHEEIFEVPTSALNPAQRREADQLIAHFESEGFLVDEPIALTFLLGSSSLLAYVDREGTPGIGISDGDEVVVFPKSDRPGSFGPEMLLALYRGRKLLRSFNGLTA